MRIRTLAEGDRRWAEEVVSTHFGSPRVVSRGVLHDARSLPGLVAEENGEPLGLLQYRIFGGGPECEVVILISVRKRRGVGRALLRAIRRLAEAAGCRRVWLVTNNDNRAAQAFYEAVGMHRCAVYPGAVHESRKLKPEIPDRGAEGVPITDEIEYQWLLV